MKRLTHIWKKYITSPAMLAAAVSAVIMILVLMVQPLIGMADNGDFFRTINGQGIYKLDRYQDDQFFDYFSSTYGTFEYYNDAGTSLFSSQNVYIQAALLLNRLFSPNPAVFDIRFLSVFLVIELVIGIYLMVDYITWKKSRLQGFLLAAVCVLMFVDTAYTAYFNSFYAEGIVYVSQLLIVASALLLTQKRYPPLPLLLSILVNGIVLIFSKQQSATEGLPLFLLCLCIAFFFQIEKKSFKRAAVAGAVLMAVLGIIMYAIIPQTFVRINQYHAMTRGALMTSENPEETLDEFDIDKQFSVLDSSIYFERYPAIEVEDEQLIDRFYDKYNFVSLSVHYLTHPGALISMLDMAAHNGYMIRPAAMGNYERTAGRAPGEQTDFFTFYSDLKSRGAPNTVGFAAIWLLVACSVAFRDRKKLMIVLCTVLMGLIQIGTSIIGAGDADLAKHIFMYNVSFDLVTFICFAPAVTSLIVYFLKAFWGLFKKKKKAVLLAAVFLIGAGGLSINAQAAEAAQVTEENEQAAEVAQAAEERAQALLLGHQGEDMEALAQLAQASGLRTVTVTDLDEAKEALQGADYIIATSPQTLREFGDREVPALCIGSEFTDIPGVTLARYQGKAVQFQEGDYTGEPAFLEEFSTVDTVQGKTSGVLLFGDGSKTPFAVWAQDGNCYVPCYDGENMGARLLLGSVIRRLTGQEGEGKTYFVMDEVYVFSDLNKLCGWAERLHESGIPFLVRIMPLYDHLDWPAFLRFTQTLRYMQSLGGTIVIHEPLVEEQQSEREPLQDKMLRLEKALTQEKVVYRELPTTPLLLSAEDLMQVTSENKNFGNLPFDLMIGVTPEMTEEEFSACLEKLGRKWLSFADLNGELENSTYLYEKQEIEEDYAYRGEKEELAFAGFFNTSDRFLLAVVGGSLVVLGVFLIIGRKWYRRKFFR